MEFLTIKDMLSLGLPHLPLGSVEVCAFEAPPLPLRALGLRQSERRCSWAGGMYWDNNGHSRIRNWRYLPYIRPI